MPKINQEEYEKIKLLPDYDWNWIAREKTGKILSFTNKPTKTDEVWKDKQIRLWFNYKDSQLFQFIQWEDEEPYEIAELIREYEIKELRLAPPGTVIVDSFDEIEETEVKKDIEWLKSWFDDDKSYTGDYVKFKINHCKWGEEVEEEQKYYAKLKGIQPLEGEWLTNLSGPNYYALDTKGLMLGEFILDLVGIKTEASTHTLKDWERYGINDSNADFVKADE